jgi:hypothetical protein
VKSGFVTFLLDNMMNVSRTLIQFNAFWQIKIAIFLNTSACQSLGDAIVDFMSGVEDFSFKYGLAWAGEHTATERQY